MRQILFLLLLFCIVQSLSAQTPYVYTIKADSVKITNTCDTAELIIENHTQTVPGFLFNRGRGRTEFRRGLFQLDDSLYLLGGDTLNLFWALNGLNANNGLLKTGNTIQFGNTEDDPYGYTAAQIRPTYYWQNYQLFNWITGQGSVFTVTKSLHSTVDSAKLKNYHIARFAAPYQQGGLLVESYVDQGVSGPLSWFMVKNTHPSAATATWYLNETFTALMEINSKRAADGKDYASYRFHLANDSANGWDQRTVLNLYPAYQPYAGRFLKLPTANVKRLDISQIGADAFQQFDYDNPYSRLLIDAANYPLLIKNLPQNSVNGRILVVDNDGKVWLGDSTSSLSGGVSTFSSLSTTNDKVKLTSDLSSTSSSLLGATGLSLNVTAGTYYKFKFVLVFATDATTTGIKLGLTAPTATVFSATANVATGSNDGANFHAQGSITSSGGFFATSSVEAANTGYIAIVEGIILPTASGTVQLTFGSGVNGSQVALKNGSMGSIETY